MKQQLKRSSTFTRGKKTTVPTPVNLASDLAGVDPTTAPRVDLVNHPPHYTMGQIECIDALESMVSRTEFIGFLRCQIVKYTWRMNNKGNPLQDAEKAQWYQNRLLSTLRQTTSKTP